LNVELLIDGLHLTTNCYQHKTQLLIFLL
jgi:hypothetical protein